jgi:hypothetical protein
MEESARSVGTSSEGDASCIRLTAVCNAEGRTPMSRYCAVRNVRLAAVASVAAAFMLFGCGDDDDDNGPSGSVDIDVAPSALNVTAGGSGSATVTVTRAGGFSGDVTLAHSGAPTGISVSFTPTSIAEGSTTSTVEVDVAGTVAAGEYPITVEASGADIGTAEATLTVTVIAEGAGSVALSANPATLSPAAGGAAVTSVITITRTAPFTGPVALTVTGAPAGVTATLTPTSATAESSTLSVQAAAGAAAGTYPMVVRGSGAGIADATTTVNVTVTAGGSSNAVTVAFCAADAPVWVAQQDGSGAWSRVNPTAGSSYTFNFASGRGGIATVDTVGTGFDVNVIYGTAAEFTSFAGTANFGGCSAKSVNGSVANVATTDVATVALGYSSTTVIPAVSSNFTLESVADGPQDLVAVRIDGTTERTNAVILRRALNPAAGSTLPVLDFSATEAFAPAAAYVTVAGVGGGETGGFLSSFTGLRGSAMANIGFGTTTGAEQQYEALPEARLNAGELQLLQAIASSAGGNSSRSAGVYFRSPTNRTITLGPALGTPTVSKAATTPYVRPRLQLTLQTEYNRLLSTTWRQGTGDRTTNVTASASYFGTPPATWDLTVPDLSTVAGWNNTWGLQDGTPIDWDVVAFGGASNFLDASIADGSTTQFASLSSSTPLNVRGLRSGPGYSILERVGAAARAALVSPLR